MKVSEIVYVAILSFLLDIVSANELQVSSTVRILRSLGYLAEDHRLIVQNGSYVLNLVRAMNPLIVNQTRSSYPNKEPILFVHGIIANADGFMTNTDGGKPMDYTSYDINSLSSDDLEKLLSDNPASNSLVTTALNFGYEVWLLNRRSTLRSFYETTIENKLPKSEESNLISWNGTYKETMQMNDFAHLQNYSRQASVNYWNFSLDEQAVLDIPETIDYVLRKSNQKKLAYVGHSAGAALLLMTLAEIPEMANQISKAVLWAPALYLKGDFRPIVRELMYLLEPYLVRLVEPLPPPYLVLPLEGLMGIVCHSKLVQLALCDPIMDFIQGDGSTQGMVGNIDNKHRFLDMVSTHEWAQLLQSGMNGKMHRLNYNDKMRNIIAYGQPNPPLYDVSKITSRTISLWAGITDLLVPARDVYKIGQDMTVPVDRRLVDGPNILFDHSSFLIHNEVRKLLIIPSLKTIASR